MDISRKFRLTLICAACAFLSAVSCRQERGIIPEDVMSKIYYDMYMTDEAIKSDNRLRRMTDTLLVYEPIFRRYGYTSEDYTRSVGYYLEHTDIYQEIFERTGQMMEKREAELKAILEAESNTPVRWSIIDSLDILTADGIHSPLYYKYMRILFFKPDTVLLRSPMPDSAAYGRPQNPFMLFSKLLCLLRSFIVYSHLIFRFIERGGNRASHVSRSDNRDSHKLSHFLPCSSPCFSMLEKPCWR